MQQWTISRSDCDMQQKVDFTYQLAMISSVAELRSSKALSKAKLVPKKIVMVSVWWSDPLQLSKSQRNYYAWEICAANQWAALMHWKLQCLQPALVNRMCPILPHVTQSILQKMNELGYKVLPHPPYSSDLSPTDYYYFKQLNFFAGKMLPQPAGHRKCFPSVYQIMKHRFLHHRNKLISLWQKCVDCNVSYFY